MNTAHILIDGKETSVEEIEMAIGFQLTLAEVHLKTWGDLSETPDAVRPYQAAMIHTGEAVVKVGNMCREHLAADLGDALGSGLKLLDTITLAHDAHWVNMDKVLDGKQPTALPTDIAESRDRLKATFDTLMATLAHYKTKVNALAVSDPKKAATEALLAMSNSIAKGVDETIFVATFEVRPDTWDLIVDHFTKQLLANQVPPLEAGEALRHLGNTSEQQAIEFERIGKKTGMLVQSTMDGAVLAAKQELDLLVHSLNDLSAYLGKST